MKQEGCGIITEIDVQATLKAKIGVDFRPYLILGACNPAMAHEALQIEDKVGAMLPCNVVVQRCADGVVEVAAIDPVASAQAIDNHALKQKASLIAGKLQEVLGRVDMGGDDPAIAPRNRLLLGAPACSRPLEAGDGAAQTSRPLPIPPRIDARELTPAN